MKVEFYRHNIGREEIKNINKVLRTLFLTTGDVTVDFEKRLARYLGCKQAVGVNSCTSALHLSLFALGIGRGDEVITTPLSFYATANAILYTGARPVFVDVESDTGNIDANLIENAVTKKTKAIVPVHMCGQMCDMRAIDRIARKYKLKVVEDAALCVEGARDGVRPAQLSDAACFSFHAIKSITSGEGGAIATDNEALAKTLRTMRLHGMGKTVKDRHRDKKKKQDMKMFGFKCNMYDLQAALLLPQLKRIDDLCRRRNILYGKYQLSFGHNSGIRLPEIKDGSKSAKTMFNIWVEPKKRDQYLAELQKAGIGVDIKYWPIHLSTYYKKAFGYRRGDYPVAERISASTITLPLYPKLKSAEADYTVKAVNKIIR